MRIVINDQDGEHYTPWGLHVHVLAKAPQPYDRAQACRRRTAETTKVASRFGFSHYPTSFRLVASLCIASRPSCQLLWPNRPSAASCKWKSRSPMKSTRCSRRFRAPRPFYECKCRRWWRSDDLRSIGFYLFINKQNTRYLVYSGGVRY